eukprot:1486173-Rhodomonas_salina.6
MPLRCQRSSPGGGECKVSAGHCRANAQENGDATCSLAEGGWGGWGEGGGRREREKRREETAWELEVSRSCRSTGQESADRSEEGRERVGQLTCRTSLRVFKWSKTEPRSSALACEKRTVNLALQRTMGAFSHRSQCSQRQILEGCDPRKVGGSGRGASIRRHDSTTLKGELHHTPSME